MSSTYSCIKRDPINTDKVIVFKQAVARYAFI